MTTNWYATELFITEHIRQMQREAATSAERRERFRARRGRLARLLDHARPSTRDKKRLSARPGTPTGVARVG